MKNKSIYSFIAVLFLLCGLLPAGGSHAAERAPYGDVNVRLYDADEASPVMKNIFMSGVLDHAAFPLLRYIGGRGDVMLDEESIIIGGMPVMNGGQPSTRFVLYSMNKKSEAVKIEWDIPNNGRSDRLGGESLRSILTTTAEARNGDYAESVFNVCCNSGNVSLVDVSYRDDEAGSSIAGYSMRVDTVLSPRHRFWRTLGGITLLNAVGEIDYFLKVDTNSRDWKYPMTWEGMKKKMSDGAELDANDFMTNAVGHVYAGNLYYTMARSNGYGFWGSTVFAFVGSVMWETVGEWKETVSANDFVYTAIGGALLGEALTQTSIYIERNFRRGFFRDAAVLVLNPMRVLNRYIDGRISDSYTVNVTFMSPAQMAAENLVKHR